MRGIFTPGISPTGIGIGTRAGRTAIARFISQETVLGGGRSGRGDLPGGHAGAPALRR
ncbi:MAG: hypothetical protein LLF90_01415 [Methanomicrobiaceae archaeon]|uniref:hypothetical protein n=1 Tax=Methanoculleus sp. TaxID=90427 RepID=UPI00320E020A|nr:hypothetical protein [Methanomicrobiaceae archaeon]